MLKEDIKYLKCIFCNSNLGIESFESKNNEIIDGKIICDICKAEWPIINSIPRIFTKILIKKLILNSYKDFFSKYEKKFKIPSNNLKDKYIKEKVKTASSFGFEWFKYSKIINIFEKDWNRYFMPNITPNDVSNKVVVDVGCGLGKQGYFTAKYGAKYIGIDLSEAVEAAYKNIKFFNPLIIQADIYNLPLKGSLIDIIYSIGVLHHLPTPKKGFLKIVDLMKNDCKLLIWVYGIHKNKRASYIYNPLRKITTKIPKIILYYLCYFPAFIVQLFNLLTLLLNKAGAKKLAKKIPFYYYSNFPFNFKVSDSFDVFATPRQEYFTKDEIKEWFKEGNLKKFDLLYDNYQGIKGFGIK